MICQKIHTQLPSGGLEDDPGPQQKSKLSERMVSSEEDRRKAGELGRLKESLPPDSRRERHLLTRKIYYLLNPEKCRRWDINHEEHKRQISKRWYNLNKERNKARVYKWRRLNPEKHRAGVRKWHKDHSEHRLAWQRKRLNSSIQWGIADRIRRTLNRALSRQFARKSARTFELTGCTPDFLKGWIEGQFVNGMSWENRKTWHVDHWIPVAAFQLSDAEEQKWAFNYRNLRPLDRLENQSKSDTLPNPLPSWLPAHIAARIIARSLPTVKIT
jgi:hypothetical protein